jgi:hypothetical protein
MKIQDLPEFRNKDSLLAMAAADTPLVTAVKAIGSNPIGCAHSSKF